MKIGDCLDAHIRASPKASPLALISHTAASSTTRRRHGEVATGRRQLTKQSVTHWSASTVSGVYTLLREALALSVSFGFVAQTEGTVAMEALLALALAAVDSHAEWWLALQRPVQERRHVSKGTLRPVAVARLLGVDRCEEVPEARVNLLAHREALRALPSCDHEAKIGAGLYEGLPLAAALHRGCLGDQRQRHWSLE